MADALMFYTIPQSRGRIVRWMLEETGIKYETTLLDDETLKSDDFLAINPMGKVPTIVHGQQVVTEAAAICAYLAHVFPGAGLMPRPQHLGNYYRWLFFAAGPIEQAMVDKALGLEPDAEQQRFAGYGSFERMVNTLVTAVTDQEYLAGNSFTAADAYVGSQIAWGMQFGLIPELPAFVAYRDRLHTRPAYQRATAIDDAAAG